MLVLTLTAPLLGNTVSFVGYTFNSFYGPEVLAINGLGQLETPTTAAAGNFGGGFYATTAAFRAEDYQYATATTLEVGAGSQPSSQFWIQDFQGTWLYEAMFGTFSGGATFRLQTRVRDLTVAGAPSVDTDDYFFTPRTAGAHTFAVSKNSANDVNWFLDGVLVATTGPGVWGSGLTQFDRVLLFAHGNADGQKSVWTDFAVSNVPEPSTVVLAGAGLLAALCARKLKAAKR